MNAFRAALVIWLPLRLRDLIALEHAEGSARHCPDLAVPHLVMSGAAGVCGPARLVGDMVETGLAARGFGHGIAPFSSCQYNSGMVWKRLEPIASAFKRMARPYEAIASERQS